MAAHAARGLAAGRQGVEFALAQHLGELVQLELSVESPEPGAIGLFGTLAVRNRGAAPIARAGVQPPRGVILILADTLPDYDLTEETGDIIRVTRRRLIEDIPGLPPFDAATLEAARQLAPGWDIYALEAEWRAFWVTSGRQSLRAPGKAFLGWLRGRVTR